MMLRVSVEMQGEAADLTPLVDPAAAAESTIPLATELVTFAESVVQGDDDTLARAREELLRIAGPEAFVDAAAVAANFQRMVRIADSTGIPLDAPVNAMTADLRAELGIDEFGSAANTPEASALARTLGRAFAPLLPRLASIARRLGRG
jgi:D-serine deaminase-like pyridoxal phosphate-dependent protein